MNHFKCKIFKEELDKSKIYVIFYITVLSLLIAALIGLICCMAYMPDEFLEFYTDNNPLIDTIAKGELSKLNKIKNDDMAIYYEGDDITYNVTVSSPYAELFLPDYLSGKSIDFDNSSDFFINETKLKGEIWGQNNTNDVWLVDGLAEYLKVTLNDCVKIYNESYLVKGIYEEDFIPLKSTFIIGKNEKAAGKECHLLINVTKNTPFLFAELSRAKIEIDDEYNYIGLYSSIMTMLLITSICCIVVGLCCIFIFINLLSYFILKRQRFKYMLISLGATKSDINRIYLLLSAFVSGISCVIGGIGAYLLTKYFSYLFKNIIGIENQIHFLWYLPVVVFIVFILISFVCIKKIKAKTINAALNEVENES